MKRILTLVLALAIAGISGSALAAVSGSPHDYSADSNYGLCNPCHVPHAANMQKRLWRQTKTWVDGSGWTDSNIGRLCGGCHMNGGALVVAQNNNGATAHPVDGSVYDTASHGRSLTELTTQLKDTPAAGDMTGRPYMQNWGDATMANKIQCSSCHDPHNNTDVKPFLRAVGGQASISEVCGGCHDRYNDSNYGTSNTLTRGNNDGGGTVASSMHPVNITYQDQVGNEGVNSNTVLRTQAELPAALRTPLANTEEWRLGGKFEGTGATGLTGNLGCNTCHAIHGTNAGDGTGDAPATNIYLLAVNNNGANNNAPLCESCHGGSGSTSFTSLALQDGTPSTGGLHYVANHQSAGIGLYDDHPIDMTPDGVPALVNWADAGNTRFERKAWGATAAGDPQSANGHWPYGAQGTYAIGGVTFGNIICISCHSAHNGITNSSLRRKGSIVSYGGIALDSPTVAQMTSGTDNDLRTTWCYSCHAVSDMVPSYHHSTNDTTGVTPANYSNGDIPGGSGAACNDCHTAGTPSSAHQGFFNLNLTGTTSTTNGSSDLCLKCHDPLDPISGSGLGANPPNGHLMSNMGTGSHYIGAFQDGATASDTWDINVKRESWRTVHYKGTDRNVYSKYGVVGGSGTDTHHLTAPAAWSSSQTVICESCHSVLFNAGWGGAAGQSNWNVEGGWRTNLLLQLYEDRAPGTGNKAAAPPYFGAAGRGPSDVDGVDTGSGFCIQCHRQTADVSGLLTGSIDALVANYDKGTVPKNMHPMTNWTITRAQDSGRARTRLTTNPADGTYADSTAASTGIAAPDPGGASSLASYPKQNGQDCDSCHRPHNAYGLIPGKPKTTTGANDTTPAILETGNLPVDTEVDQVCLACHNR